MESRSFIKSAAALIEKIAHNPANEVSDEAAVTIQRELNLMFGGLQNPTLPSAYRLRDAAIKAGYTVAPQHLQRLAQAEHLG